MKYLRKTRIRYKNQIKDIIIDLIIHFIIAILINTTIFILLYQIFI